MIGLDARRATFAALIASALIAGDAGAQAVSLHGGARLYDDGGMPTAAIRTEFPLAGPLLVELAGSVADEAEDVPRSLTSLLEAQVQLAIPIGGGITPYVGAGVGAGRLRGFAEYEGEWEQVYSLGAGARVPLSEQLGLVVDARIHDITDDAGDESTDVTVGLRYQFLPRDRPRFRGAP